MGLVSSSYKYYRIVTLEKLIRKLFKKHKLKENVHFDVWICGYTDEKETAINIDDPWACCHFMGYDGSQDGTDVYQWLRFEVEDYEFEITDSNEYHLFVKLVGINSDFSQKRLNY